MSDRLLKRAEFAGVKGVRFNFLKRLVDNARLAVCRGGCKVVSAHTGRDREPDPECPRVVDYRSAKNTPRRLQVIHVNRP